MAFRLLSYPMVIPRPTIIWNPTAGGATGGIDAETLTALFRSHNQEPRLLAAGGEVEMRAFASHAVADSAGPVIAAGGDGTVSAVAEVLAHTAVPLGVLPFGTLNHFARDLGIPLDPAEAVRVIAENQIRSVDVGEVNGRVFINNSSLGLYPLIVRRRERHRRLGYGKWLAFFLGLVSALRDYPLLHLRLEVEGRELRRESPLAFVGNNPYRMEGIHLGSRDSLSGGTLCLFVTHRTGRLGLVALCVSAVMGRPTRSQCWDGFTAREVWIESRTRRLHVAVDGEVLAMASPLHYRVLPGALRVIVPQAPAS